MKRINIICIITVLLLFITASCTKVIDLKLGDKTGELVIEANIVNTDGPQVVQLSRNVPFTSTNTYPAVSGATVVITDDENTDVVLDEGPAGFYSAAQFTGTPGKTYHLSVTTDGKVYKATSTMPRPVTLDSVSTTDSQFNKGKNQKVLTVHFSDPPNIANQYRFILYVNSVQVKTIFAFDDDFSDGRNVNIDLFENDIDIFPGDVVSIEMECIDKPVYTYWFTQQQQQANNPGGGVAPSNPPTNITPTTLGYFSAHTTQRLTFVVR